MKIKKHKIYVDSADPRAISYYSSKGIRAEKAKKGKNSVATGISFLQNHKIVCHTNCVNVATELENYVYLKDKATGQLCEDKTDHDYSHSLDKLVSSINRGIKRENLRWQPEPKAIRSIVRGRD